QTLAEVDAEMASTVQLHQAAAAQRSTVEKQLEECRQRIAEIEAEAARSDEQLQAKEAALRDATDRVMAISVDLARAEQKTEALTATLEQQRRDQAERQAAVEEVR